MTRARPTRLQLLNRSDQPVHLLFGRVARAPCTQQAVLLMAEEPDDRASVEIAVGGEHSGRCKRLCNLRRRLPPYRERHGWRSRRAGARPVKGHTIQRLQPRPQACEQLLSSLVKLRKGTREALAPSASTAGTLRVVPARAVAAAAVSR